MSTNAAILGFILWFTLCYTIDLTLPHGVVRTLRLTFFVFVWWAIDDPWGEL